MSFSLDGYKTVPQRLAEFRARFPDGRLCAADPTRPYYIETIGNQSYVVYVAAAYRSPEDAKPGIGVAWECVPGKTPYTKDSELQNAETSAWGRALVAALIVDPGQSVASRDDIERRQEPQGPDRATAEDVEEIEEAMAALTDAQRAELRQWWKVREYGSLRPKNPMRKLIASDVESVLDEIHRLAHEPTEPAEPGLLV